jgi:hypothetical protein
MKALLLFLGFSAHAATTCPALAVKAATQVYALNDHAAPVSSTNVRVNPNNTSNGVSLIVTVNNRTEYLVLLNAASPSGDTSTGCSGVNYVIAYPYANLIRQ